MRPTPVYLVTGFLESGKTTFINDTLKDKNFCGKSNVLLISCEEGESEYTKEEYASKKVSIHTIEDKEDLTEENLLSFAKESRLTDSDIVVVEYNGMWQIEDFYNVLPQNWIVGQEVCIIDSKTILNYNSNMRGLVVNKIQGAAMVAFNRVDPKEDTMPFHKLVRGLTRQATILYETTEGKISVDDIEDPLPFDINAPVIQIQDRDYALFYRDLTEKMENYNNKNVRFKGIVSKEYLKDKDAMLLGRNVMTCCADDIRYMPMIAIFGNCKIFSTGEWVEAEGTILIQKHSLYKSKGPILKCTKITPCQPPEEPVASFW